MKKMFFLMLVLTLTLGGFAQVPKDSAIRRVTIQPAGTVQNKIIPSTRATLIRKDASKLRLHLTQLKDSVTVVKREIDMAIDQMKNDLDSMSEMGETESLRLQMAMDRVNKMFSTLSNLLKKASDTAQSITQNLK